MHGTYTNSPSLRIIATILAFTAIAMVATRYAPASAAVILLTGAAKSFESISDIFFGLFQRREELRYMAISMIVKGIVMVPAAALALHFGRSAAWGVSGMLVVWIAVLVFYELPRASPVRFIWNPRAFASLAWSSLPLGLVMMLFSFKTNIPRHGLTGAGLAVLVASCVQLALNLALIVYVLKVQLSRTPSSDMLSR